MAPALLVVGLTLDCVAAAFLGLLMFLLSPSLGGKDQNRRPPQITYSALSSLMLAMLYLLIAISYESVGVRSEPGKTICLLNEFLPIVWQLSRLCLQFLWAFRIELIFKGSTLSIPEKKMLLLKSSVCLIYSLGCIAAAIVGFIHYTTDRHSHHGNDNDEHEKDEHTKYANTRSDDFSFNSGFELDIEEDNHDDHSSNSEGHCLITDLDHWLDWQTLLVMGLFVLFDTGLAIVQIRLYIRRLYRLIVEYSTDKYETGAPPTTRVTSVSNQTDHEMDDMNANNNDNNNNNRQLSRPPSQNLSPTVSEESVSGKRLSGLKFKSRSITSNKRNQHLLNYVKRTTILAVISIVSSLINTALLVVLGRIALAMDILVNALCIYFSFNISLPVWRKLCEDSSLAKMIPSCLPGLFYCCSLDICECDMFDWAVCKD